MSYHNTTPLDVRITRLEAHIRYMDELLFGNEGRRGTGPIIKNRKDAVKLLAELRAELAARGAE